jgi:hypothetical protein
MKTLFELDLTRRLTIAFTVAAATFSLIQGFVDVSERHLQEVRAQGTVIASMVQRA